MAHCCEMQSLKATKQTRLIPTEHQKRRKEKLCSFLSVCDTVPCSCKNLSTSHSLWEYHHLYILPHDVSFSVSVSPVLSTKYPDKRPCLNLSVLTYSGTWYYHEAQNIHIDTTAFFKDLCHWWRADWRQNYDVVLQIPPTLGLCSPARTSHSSILSLTSTLLSLCSPGCTFMTLKYHDMARKSKMPCTNMLSCSNNSYCLTSSLHQP